MPKVKVTQVKSLIDRPERDKKTIKALGLGRISKTVIKEVNPAILGQLRCVSHLIRVEELKD